MARVTKSRAADSAGKRSGGRLAGDIRTLRDRLAHKAIERELRRLRELLELGPDEAYSDLFVLQRARQYLAEVLDDDRAEEINELAELDEDGDDE